MSIIRRVRHGNQDGFTLPELLVTALIGMIILGVIASLYFANRRVYQHQESYARLQETGRYLMGRVGADVRNATYSGCGPISTLVNVVSNNSTSWWLNTNRMIWGYDQGGALPTELSGSVADSDALVVLYRGVAGEFMITGHDLTNKRFTTGANHTFAQGSVLFATDCARSGVFRMSNAVGGPTATVEYEAGALGGGYDNDAAVSLTPTKFASGGFISPMVANAYYVTLSTDAAFTTNPCPSEDAAWTRRVLAVRTLAGSTTGQVAAPQPVACDVHNFQVRFGLDNDGDLSADEFRTATNLGTDQALWGRVVSVRTDFLVVNSRQNTLESDHRYCLDYAGGANPESCPAAANTTYTQVWNSTAANGRRAAKVFTTTFNFRNRTS